MLKRIFETLGLRPKQIVPPSPAGKELHKLPWHPFFYKALKIHMDNTTPRS